MVYLQFIIVMLGNVWEIIENEIYKVKKNYNKLLKERELTLWDCLIAKREFTEGKL